MDVAVKVPVGVTVGVLVGVGVGIGPVGVRVAVQVEVGVKKTGLGKAVAWMGAGGIKGVSRLFRQETSDRPQRRTAVKRRMGVFIIYQPFKPAQ